MYEPKGKYISKEVAMLDYKSMMDTFLRRAIPNYWLMRSTGVRRLHTVGKAVAPLGRIIIPL